MTIDIPDGMSYDHHEIDGDGNIRVYLNEVPSKSRTWAEYCENHPSVQGEFRIDSITDHIMSGDGNRHMRRTYLETEDDAIAIRTLMMLTRLHKDWVGTWNCMNTGNRYWSICVQNGELRVVDWNQTNFFLSFPHRDMAEDFLSCFKNYIEQAKKYI